MSEQSSGFSWFIAGLGLGALVGVLYAPKSGRETREELISSARDGSDYLKARGRDAATQVNAYADRGRERVGEYADRGRERVQEYADRGRAQWDDLVKQGQGFVKDKSSKITAAVEAGKQAYETAASPETHAGPPATKAPEGQA